MFFSLFLFVVVILSVVSVSSLTALDDHQSTARLMASTATFYAAESSLEESKYQLKINKESDSLKGNSLIRSFQLEKNDPSQKTGKLISSDYEIDIVERKFNEAPEQLDIKNEPKNFDEFRFIDVDSDYLFSSLDFYFQKTGEYFSGGLLIDIISFPRIYFQSTDKNKINFGNVNRLSTQWGDIDRNVNRMMIRYLPAINKVDQSSTVEGLQVKTLTATAEFENGLSIRNLDPQNHNYIFRFRTLDKTPVHYSLRAIYNGNQVPLHLTNQQLEIDSQAATMNMFQRVRQQQRGFSPLQPGLDFVLFSDKEISK